MKTKMLILLIMFFSALIAQQKNTANTDKGKQEYAELQKYPVPLTPIKPLYPEAAKLGGVQGKVYVEAMIDEKGNVTETKIIKSEQEALNNSAMDAIKKTKFTPGISKENKKVKCKVVIPINFKLDDDKMAAELGKPVDGPGDVSDPDINANIKVEKMPEMIEAGKPVYPDEAKKNSITGKAFVKVLISKDGAPKKAIVIKSDNELFNQPAVDAAMRSKFSSALQEGKPVAVWVVLPYRFTLDGVTDNNKWEKNFAFIVDETCKEYPEEAKQKKTEGKVLVRIFLDDKSGKLTGAEVYKSENEILNSAAIKRIENEWDKVDTKDKKLFALESGSIIIVFFRLDGFQKK